MKTISLCFVALILFAITNSRVLLNRHHREQKRPNLYTNYPRYLVPNRNPTQIEDANEMIRDNTEKLSLDNHHPKERELFMMTNFEAQKERFGQRMKCRFIDLIMEMAIF